MVASEVGDSKREIVYFGDTINTAARLCSNCKKLNRRILISSWLFDQMSRPSSIETEVLKDVQMDGKARAMDLVSISPLDGAGMISDR